jgi:NDP-sugar pyrophosphorylase family protein
MAGGKGSRLYPYTAVLPKPLMPLGDVPVLELILRQLRGHGVRSVFLAVNHLRHLIQAFFGDGSAFGIDIAYSTEEAPLGTGGPVGVLLERMAENFLVLNGDLVTNLSMSGLLDYHVNESADATIATILREVTLESGVLDIDPRGHVVGYREKPSNTYAISMGLYALRRDAMRGLVEPGRHIDMPDLLLRMIAAGRRVVSYRAECLWLDIGRPDDYARAQDLVAAHSELLMPVDPALAEG